MSDIKIEIYASAIRDDIAELGQKNTKCFDVLDRKLELALNQVRDGQAQIASRVNKMRWGTFWSLCMIAVVQAVMFAALGYYMHEYIRGNAECIRGNAECLAYMKEPAECECEANPLCHTSDADCYKCWANLNFKFMADMLNE